MSNTPPVNISMEQMVGEIHRLRAEVTALAASNTLANRPAKMEKPNKFVGTRDPIAVNNWIYSTRKYLEHYQLHGQEALDIAVSFLEKEALSFYLDKGPVGGSEALFEMIKNQFIPPTGDYNHRRALASIRQTTTVREYATQFRSLLQKIGAGNYNEKDAVWKEVLGRTAKPKNPARDTSQADY